MQIVIGQRRHRDAAGLTLVEVLVVVALLAIMLAVMLPTLTNVRAEGFRAGCEQNLLEVGRGVARSMADADGALPRARSLAPPVMEASGHPPLSVVLVGRIRARASAFACPGDGSSLYAISGTSYYYNAALAGARVEQLSSPPATTPLVWDADQTTFITHRGPLAIRRFHEYRLSLFADLHVARAGDRQTRMP